MKIIRFLMHRVVLTALSMAVQLALLLLMVFRFNEEYVWYYTLTVVACAVVVLSIILGERNPSYKIAWLVPVMALPVFGVLIYLIFGRDKLGRRLKQKMKGMESSMRQLLKQDEETALRLEAQSPQAARQSRYMTDWAFCPIYEGVRTEFFAMGEDKFKRLLERLKQAEKFIFLEYFILEEGVMWDSILEVLEQKARQGVDVRVIFDDLGCIMLLPYRYDKKLESMGIKCRIFNPFVPVLSPKLNNRDHRKIVVIDGKTGFTGGINLADEYINQKPRFGMWKDCGVMLEGAAVRSLTVMFLSMWSYIGGETEDYTPFLPAMEKHPEAEGFVQPYADSPLDGEPVGKTVYMNLINRAERYIYIETPYLIIDYEMVNALCDAAKSGVDVRIITPGIPDKWYVHMVTRAHYAILVENGVKIFEYAPGFIHAKTFVVDDTYATCGTVNLDFRSLYLHFECGVWMYKTECIERMKRDFLATVEVSRSVTREQCAAVPWYTRLARQLLSVFSPLM